MTAEWDALTDLHCYICGPKPGYYTRAEHPWPLIWLHDRCKPEHERRQQAAMQNVQIGSVPVYPEAREWLAMYIQDLPRR